MTREDFPKPYTLVSCTFAKDGPQIVALAHAMPRDSWPVESWVVSTFDGKSWVDIQTFPSDPDSYKAACTAYVTRASALVLQYPSWIKH